MFHADVVSSLKGILFYFKVPVRRFDIDFNPIWSIDLVPNWLVRKYNGMTIWKRAFTEKITIWHANEQLTGPKVMFMSSEITPS